jgi:RNA-directed DNA polymerase
VTSPLLLNIAMQGMEEAAGARYDKNCHAKPGTPAVVTYADLCRGRHKSAYAEARVMPTGLLDGPPGGRGVVLSAA